MSWFMSERISIDVYAYGTRPSSYYSVSSNLDETFEARQSICISSRQTKITKVVAYRWWWGDTTGSSATVRACK